MNRAASRYSKALLSLTIDKSASKEVNDDMKNIVEVIKDNKNLSNVLQSPVISSSDKKAILTKVFKDLHKITNNLINTLVSNKRIALIGDVALKYNALYDALKDEQIALVTTATPLDKSLEAKVLLKIKDFTNKNTNIKNIVDESIIGGFILRIGDLQYDASIANQFSTLRREFTIN